MFGFTSKSATPKTWFVRAANANSAPDTRARSASVLIGSKARWGKPVAGVAFLLATSGCMTPEVTRSANSLTIHADPGGSVTARFEEMQRLDREAVAIRISGTCNSSCTMYLGAANTCVEPNASLAFHGPSLSGRALSTEAHAYYTDMIAANYGPNLRRWFLENAAQLRRDAIHLTGQQVHDLDPGHVTLC